MESATLRKIEWTSLEQLMEDLNYNFAVQENSPLYKGVIGNNGQNIVGAEGKRGSSFLFVNLAQFQAQFPAQLTTGSDITIDYINGKLLDFTSKNKLLVALGVNELVDNDIIVLTNSLMTTFDFDQNKISNTGISFNESVNLNSKIDQLVKDAVAEGLENNPILNSLSNIFTSYNTLAKNYADTNNTHTTTSILPTSVYSPYIPNYTSDGILVDNHKYFGFTDEKFGVNDNGTFIFGSVKRYYQILQATINTDTAQTLTSEYSVGVGNIPSLVVMQDTFNAGLLLGYKNNPNMKRFASIYKNEAHELVLETDSGNNPSEFSRLLLHKDYMKYAKLVQFGNDLEVSRDTKLFGDTLSKGYRTGQFTTGANAGNSYNQFITEIGVNASSGTTKTKVVSTSVDFNEYKSNVLLTDANGVMLKTHSLETAVPSETTPMIGFNALETNIINSPTKVLTSNYYNYLARKINVVSAFTNANYWKKSEWNTGVIPSLHLYNTLTVDVDANIGGVMSISNADRKFTVYGTLAEINSVDVSLTEYKGKVLITDTNGKISKDYSLETQALNANDLVAGNTLTSIGASDKSILTTKYYDHLLKKINGNNADLADKYWSKAQFGSTAGVAGNIRVAEGYVLMSYGGVDFRIGGGTLIKTSLVGNVKTLDLGHNESNTNFNGAINFMKFKNKVLVTNANGDLLDTKFIETVKWNETTDLTANNPIPNSVGTDDNSFAMGYHVNWLARKINNILNWFVSNFWTKSQFNSGVIPNLVLSDTLTSKAIRVGADTGNPNIYTDGGSDTLIGKTNGNSILRGTVRVQAKPSTVLVTDNTGNIVDNKLENSIPASSTHTGSSLGNTVDQIRDAYWEKDTVEPEHGAGSSRDQNFINYPTESTRHVTSNYLDIFTKHIINIRRMLYNRPTFAYCDANYGGSGGGVPNGVIAYWNMAFGAVPEGWIICDGRIIPGLNVPTPNWIDKFVEGSLTPNVISGAENHRISLEITNLPMHDHYMPGHTHTYIKAVVGQGFRTNTDKNPLQNLVEDTTGYGGAGYTNQTGNKTPFSIKPRSISAIPIMKYWDGRGDIPTINMPPFATITNITQNNTQTLNEATFYFTRQDTTVTSFGIWLKRSTGVNAGQWVLWSIQPNTIGMPFTLNCQQWNETVQWKFVANNGNSYNTNGAETLEYSVALSWSAPPLPATPPAPDPLVLTFTGSYANSDEKVRLDWSVVQSQLPIQLYEIFFAQRINSGTMTAWTSLRKIYSANAYYTEFNVQSSANPANYTTLYYKVRAIDNNNNNSPDSNVVQQTINRNYSDL